MPGIRHSEEVREQAIRLVLESNTPIAQVTRTIGCSLGTLNRWLRQHRHVADDVQSSEAATFIPVNIIDHKSPIEIVTPNGFILRLNDASSQYVAELLKSLISC